LGDRPIVVGITKIVTVGWHITGAFAHNPRPCWKGMRQQPKRAGGGGRIYASLLPPCRFVATAMHLAMMAAAERHGELIADLAVECPALSKPEMMGTCRPPAANQAKMLGDRSNVIPVTHAAGLGYGQHALID
jgi:hypothetical protein